MTINSLSDSELAQVLEKGGFEPSQYWLNFARLRSFKNISSTAITQCPSCGREAPPCGTRIGQYVYYSTLISLLPCPQCGLIYGNRRVPVEVVQSHFDQGYKDEDYFFNARAKIFTQLTGLLSEVTRKSGKVLDIGGAKGHLLNALHSDRSDLDLTLSDISAVACEFAKKHFSIRAIHGGIEALKGEGPFDAIVLSDVIYYEYDLAALWRLLSKISAENGAIVIRVPNKILLIRIIQKLKELMKPKFKREQYKISFFNPEHLYLLTDKYLKKSLRDAGFGSITVIPAEPLRPQGFALGAAFMSFLFRAIWVISGGWLVLSPSKIYVAKRPVR